MSENLISVQTKFKGINNNQLKIIAMIAMFLDHLGKMIFPEVIILQIIGRMALPIFAYMIAEGCKYTKNRLKYFLQIFILGLGCQVGFFIAMQSLYQGILITFTLSIIIIFCLDKFINAKNFKNFCIAFIGVAFSLFFGLILPLIDKSKQYQIDYGYLAMLFPVAIYYVPKKWGKLLCVILFCTLFGLILSPSLFYMFLALPLLAIYNGTRGKTNLKYMFYVFYPAHLAFVYLLYMLKYFY